MAVMDFEAGAGSFGCRVAMEMRSGWAAKVGTPDYRTNAEGAFAFPGFSKAATDLLAERGAASIGVDTLSLDPGNSADFAVHNSWLPSGHFGIENLANLDQLPVARATVFIGAPKHGQGTGGPARVHGPAGRAPHAWPAGAAGGRRPRSGGDLGAVAVVGVVRDHGEPLQAEQVAEGVDHDRGD